MVGWALFLSWLRRADSKLFALLLRTLATKANLTLPYRVGRWAPLIGRRGLHQAKTGPGSGWGHFLFEPNIVRCL